MRRLPLSWVRPKWAVVPLLSLIQAAHQKQPRSLTEAVPSQLTSQHTSKTQATLTLTTLQCGSTRRQGWQRLGGVIGWEGKRRLAHRSASDWSEENNCGYPHRQCIGGSLGRPLSLADAGWEPVQGALASALSSCLGHGPGAERWKAHT